MHTQRGAGWTLFLSLCGIAVTSYLAFIHFGMLRGELIAVPGCGSGAFNCHAVTASAWSTFLGVPLALWGLLSYLVIFSLSLFAFQSTESAGHVITLILLISLAAVVVDAVLLTLMVGTIRLYCLFCLITYGINVLLLCVASQSLGYPGGQVFQKCWKATGAILPSAQRPATWLLWGLFLLSIFASGALHAATIFVSRGTLKTNLEQVRTFLDQQPRVSVDVTGDPTHGSAGAPLQIIEFSDLLCPACQRASKMNTIILASHRKNAEFIFKNFPLDTSCNTSVNRMVHPGACQLAAASECVHRQQKFWEFHDLVFAGKTPYNVANLQADLVRLGVDVRQFQACMDAGEGMEAVKRDLAEGRKIEVTSTPTYVINGVKVPGLIGPQAFEQIVLALRERR